MRALDRRSFITGLGAVLAVPYLAGAQQEARILRIGFLLAQRAQDDSTLRSRDAFELGLQKLGWTVGKNLLIEYRFAEGNVERYPGLAADLVKLGVKVIIAVNNPAVAAAQKATKTIPIVMVFPVDPVGAGLVTSLSRPGDNTTGLSLQLADIAGKRIEFVKQLIPAATQVSVLWDPSFPGNRGAIDETQHAATRAGIQLHVFEASSRADVDAAYAAIGRSRDQAVIVWGSDALFGQRARIAELATKARLPTLCPFRAYVSAGCLLSYSASLTELCGDAAIYVDKILKGAKPADLPVEQPTKFELVINLKTAKALGLTIPSSLLLRADQVIE